tara:strand:- start:201 stop:440 length:240 start_codon:yes stop_codon:yes gene_type:complete
MLRDKFKIGDLVRWKPSRYDRQKGDTEDTGIVIELGETANSFGQPLKRYALIQWAQLGRARIIYEDSSWEKTEILARTK